MTQKLSSISINPDGNCGPRALASAMDDKNNSNPDLFMNTVYGPILNSSESSFEKQEKLAVLLRKQIVQEIQANEDYGQLVINPAFEKYRSCVQDNEGGIASFKKEHPEFDYPTMTNAFKNLVEEKSQDTALSPQELSRLGSQYAEHLSKDGAWVSLADLQLVAKSLNLDIKFCNIENISSAQLQPNEIVLENINGNHWQPKVTENYAKQYGAELKAEYRKSAESFNLDKNFTFFKSSLSESVKQLKGKHQDHQYNLFDNDSANQLATDLLKDKSYESKPEPGQAMSEKEQQQFLSDRALAEFLQDTEVEQYLSSLKP